MYLSNQMKIGVGVLQGQAPSGELKNNIWTIYLTCPLIIYSFLFPPDKLEKAIKPESVIGLLYSQKFQEQVLELPPYEL